MRGELPQTPSISENLTALARPNIIFRSDENWLCDRKSQQTNRFELFKRRLATHQSSCVPSYSGDKPEVAIIEIGVHPANRRVGVGDEVRIMMSRDEYKAALIRINPLDGEIQDAAHEISLPLGALTALTEIDKHLK